MLPPWLAVPVSLLLLFIPLWPTLREGVQELSARNRLYEREKRRLELVKLWHEVEVFGKEKGVEPPAEELLSPNLRLESDEIVITRLKGFLYGAFGSFSVFLVDFLLTPVLSRDPIQGFDRPLVYFFENPRTLLSSLLYVFLLAGLAGLAAVFLLKNQGTARRYFVVGFLFTLLLATVKGMANASP